MLRRNLFSFYVIAILVLLIPSITMAEPVSNKKVSLKQVDTSGPRTLTKKYKNGKLSSRYRLERGLLNGVTTRYYNTGRLSRALHFTDGQPSCQWLAFNRKGELEWSHYYFPCNDGKIMIKRKTAPRKAPLSLKYAYVCKYSGMGKFRCKSIPEIVHDLGTFMPETFLADLLEGLNELVDESNQRSKLPALVGCTEPQRKQGIAVIDVYDAIQKEKLSGPTTSDMTVGQLNDFLQSALSGGGGGSADRLHKALQSACANADKFVGRGDGGNSSQGPSDSDALETAIGGTIDASATTNAETILRDGIKACKDREAQNRLTPSPEWLPLLRAIGIAIVSGAIVTLGFDKGYDEIKESMDDGFKEGEECVNTGPQTICKHETDPNRIQITDNMTGGVSQVTTLPNGNIVTTTTKEEETTNGGKNTTTTSVETTPSGAVVQKAVLVKAELRGPGTDRDVYSLTINSPNPDGTETVKLYFSETGKNGSWRLAHEYTTSTPRAGGAGLPPDDHISLCTRIETFLDTCIAVNWSSKRCQDFARLANGCDDPRRVNPGPDGTVVCTAPQGKADARDIKTMHCGRLGSIMIVNPEGDYSCSPLEPNRQVLEQPICNDPRAMCSPIDETPGIPGS